MKNHNFATLIKQLRLDRAAANGAHLSMSKIAKGMGLSRQYISLLENGTNFPGVRVLSKFIDYYPNEWRKILSSVDINIPKGHK